VSSLTAAYQLLVAEPVTGIGSPTGCSGTVADRRVHFNGSGGGGFCDVRVTAVDRYSAVSVDVARARKTRRQVRSLRRGVRDTGEHGRAGFRGSYGSSRAADDVGNDITIILLNRVRRPPTIQCTNYNEISTREVFRSGVLRQR